VRERTLLPSRRPGDSLRDPHCRDEGQDLHTVYDALENLEHALPAADFARDGTALLARQRLVEHSDCQPHIFAGINRCDWVAEGVIKALREVGVPVPLVVRLSGTNMEEGRRILAESGENIIVAETLAEAADKAVRAWRAFTANKTA
jgi:hypothetical protein